MSQNQKGKSKGPECCVDTVDKWGARIVFHEKHREFKSKFHKELEDLSTGGFVKKRIPDALLDPLSVWQDLTDPKVKNYYKLYSQLNFFGNIIYNYTKVVVLTKFRPWIIISSYECQNIKEQGGSKKCLYQKS